MAKIKITQVKSTIDRPHRQVKTLKALGLGRIGKTVEQEKTPQIEGMIGKVSHLIETSESKG